MRRAFDRDPGAPLLVQVIGAGVAGAGVVIAADRRGVLDEVLDAGIVLCDRGRAGGFESLRYDIESNSPGADFTAGIRGDGVFGANLREPPLAGIAAAGSKRVALTAVSRGIAGILRRFEHYARERGRPPPIRYGTRVRRILRDADGAFVSVDDRAQPVARSRMVVLALGAEPRHGDLAQWRHRDRTGRAAIASSDRVLRGALDRRCARLLAAGRRLMVVGSSHSGWSVVHRLLTLGGPTLRPGQIVVSERAAAPLYWSAQEAAEAGPQAVGTVCPYTHEVNRFDGLRGVARTVCRRHRQGLLPVLEVVGHRPPGDTGDAAMVIVCTGYAARPIELRDPSGRPVVLGSRGGNREQAPSGELVDAAGRPIPNLFGVGLGHARRVRGVVQVGVNVFHGEGAERIVQRCETLLRRPGRVRAV